jgi:hypothetical protein
MTPRAADSAAWTLCDASQPGARCDVNVVRNDGTGRYSCSMGRFDVNPEFLEFRGGRPVNVRFNLPSGFEFCAGDGAALKAGSLSSSYPQLYESFGADKNDGTRADAAKACRQFWIWNWGNVGAGTQHEYLIRFRDREGRQCTIDPFFKNG